MNNDNLDITKNIKIIEMLKCQMLNNISLLYENMNQKNADIDVKETIMANIIITDFIMSNKIGFSYPQLENKVIKKLKVDILDKNDIMYFEKQELLSYISSRISN